jgi:hypothetical protein
MAGWVVWLAADSFTVSKIKAITPRLTDLVPRSSVFEVKKNPQPLDGVAGLVA